MLIVVDILTRFTGSSGKSLIQFMRLGRLTAMNADYCKDPFECPRLVRVAFEFLWDFLSTESRIS